MINGPQDGPQIPRTVVVDAGVSNGGSESIDPLVTLELRLADGFQRIDVARNCGEDVSAWEDFWIELLHRYEALCDEDRIAA